MSGSPRRILLIEDEPGLVMTVSDRLGNAGYLVESVGDGPRGLQYALKGGYDLLILDLMLPGRNGLDLCRELRRAGERVPVIMLTARGEVGQKVDGLRAGADDYLAKPFEMIELLARVEALLRRANPDEAVATSASPAQHVAFGEVEVDLSNAAVVRNGLPVELSALEFRLLRYFIEHRHQTLSREELLHHVWGYNTLVSTRTVDVHVAWLRQKVEANSRHPRHILTVHGVGYKFIG